ncbi:MULTISPECIES: hypothetical protein [unclassified Streptomyces]|uniref:hypothetical protein n=1 Tax=unclassified Streptomyces TaxID=2593676 RepID=UPI0037F59385
MALGDPGHDDEPDPALTELAGEVGSLRLGQEHVEPLDLALRHGQCLVLDEHREGAVLGTLRTDVDPGLGAGGGGRVLQEFGEQVGGVDHGVPGDGSRGAGHDLHPRVVLGRADRHAQHGLDLGGGADLPGAAASERGKAFDGAP